MRYTNSQRTGQTDCGAVATNISVTMTTDLQGNVIFYLVNERQQLTTATAQYFMNVLFFYLYIS